jgi:hypothetical protein
LAEKSFNFRNFNMLASYTSGEAAEVWFIGLRAIMMQNLQTDDTSWPDCSLDVAVRAAVDS